MNIAGPAKVIAVSAPPGGGKTTLSRLLAARLGATLLNYDDHEQFTRRPPAEIEAWLERGAPIEEIPLPGFTEKLATLRAAGGRPVVIDTLLGRAHPPTAAMIDFAIFVDTPLDVALARTLRRQAQHVAHTADPERMCGFPIWLDGYLDNYLRFVRHSYALQRATVLPVADVVLDGTLAPERLAELALRAIAERC